MDVHAGLISPKSVENLLLDMHYQSKRLAYQASRVRGLLNEFNKYVKKIRSKKEAKEDTEQVLVRILTELKGLFELEEKGEDLIVRYGATAEKKALEEVQAIYAETMKLVAGIQIPRKTGEDIKKEVIDELNEIKGDIKEEAIIALEVKRKRGSLAMQTLGALRTTRMAATGQKRRIYKAEKAAKHVNEYHKRLQKDKKMHELDKIKVDLHEELEGDEEIISFINADIKLVCLFMQRIRETIEELKEGIKKVGSPRKLAAIHKTIEQEWQYFMNDISRVLQQLRFSVAPAEMRRAA